MYFYNATSERQKNWPWLPALTFVVFVVLHIAMKSCLEVGKVEVFFPSKKLSQHLLAARHKALTVTRNEWNAKWRLGWCVDLVKEFGSGWSLVGWSLKEFAKKDGNRMDIKRIGNIHTIYTYINAKRIICIHVLIVDRQWGSMDSMDWMDFPFANLRHEAQWCHFRAVERLSLKVILRSN